MKPTNLFISSIIFGGSDPKALLHKGWEGGGSGKGGSGRGGEASFFARVGGGDDPLSSPPVRFLPLAGVAVGSWPQAQSCEVEDWCTAGEGHSRSSNDRGVIKGRLLAKHNFRLSGSTFERT